MPPRGSEFSPIPLNSEGSSQVDQVFPYGVDTVFVKIPMISIAKEVEFEGF